jgi:hypothetical protein
LEYSNKNKLILDFYKGISAYQPIPNLVKDKNGDMTEISTVFDDGGY